MRAAWRKDPGPLVPPFSELPTSSDLSPNKSDINSSMLPMISYEGGGILRRESEIKVEALPGAARRESEMDIVAAMGQSHPEGLSSARDVEAAPVPTAHTRRGSRKEVDGSVL